MATLTIKTPNPVAAAFTGTVVSVWLLFILAALPAWLTHVFVCFTDERWGFLIAGALFWPVAVVHGIGIWFGVW